MKALQKSGLELIQPDPEEARLWREAVARSSTEAAEAGKIDARLLQQLQGLLAEYRGQPDS